MRIDVALPQLSGGADLLRQAAMGVRILAGDLPELPPGELIPARILQATPNQTLVQVKGTQVLLAALPGFAAGQEIQVRLATHALEPLLQVLPQPRPSTDQGGLHRKQGSLPPIQPQPRPTADPVTVRAGQEPLLPTLAKPRPAPDLASLRVGQEFSISLLEEVSDGRVLIDVQGTEVEAAAPETLPRGERLAVVVEQLHPEVVLRILDPPRHAEAQAKQILREHLPARQPLGQVLHDLQAALADAPQETVCPSAIPLQTALRDLLGPGQPPTPEQVAKVLRDGGLQYEAKLASGVPDGKPAFVRIAATDLKGLLLQTLREVDTQATSPAPRTSPPALRVGNESLMQAVARGAREFLAQAKDAPSEAADSMEAARTRTPETPASAGPRTQPEPAEAPRLAQTLLHQLNQIETQQAINLLAHAQGGPYHFQVPVGDGTHFTTAALAVERDPRGADGQAGGSHGHNLYFHLDLDQLGPLKIDAHITPRTLRAIFYTERPQTQQRMQTELAAFREALQGRGYDEVLLAVRPLQQMTVAKQRKFAGLANGVPERINLLDVRA